VNKLKAELNLTYTPEQILVSCGAKHSIYNALLALCEEGDEVIIPTPYWVSYPEMVKLTGATPVFLKTTQQQNFRFSAADLKKVVTDKTKLLILNSPSNPTGQAFSKEELAAIAEVAVANKFYVLSDEIYETLVYDGFHHVSMASLGDAISAQTIFVSGASKSYAMTGWRIGYAAGGKEIITAMGNIQSQTTSHPASISQKAALAAFSGNQEPIHRMVKEFEKRKNLIVELLRQVPGVSCLDPQGAFYAFPDFSRYTGIKIKGREIKTTQDLAAYLLEAVQVAVVPGDEFGAPGYLRLSYATSEQNIKKGIQRIKEALL